MTGDDKELLVHQFCNQQHSSMMAKRLNIPAEALKDHLHDPTVSTSFGVFVANKLQLAKKSRKGDDSLNLFNNQVETAADSEEPA
jgi:hypothetical protein